jgi:hypothetical protein
MLGDKVYIFFANYTAPTWSCWDPETDSMIGVAVAPFIPSTDAYNGRAWIVWDGNDYIYLHRGAATASFSRYSISGDSWTNLTNSPANFTTTSGYGNRLVYVPAAESGHAEDRIYALGGIAATDTRVYYVDGASANTWGASSIANFLRNQYDNPTILNGSNIALATRSGATGLYAYDFAAETSNSVAVGNFSSNFTQGAIYYVDRYVCDLRAHTSMTYHFVCDKDHFAVAVKHSDGKWFWTYGGAIDVYSRGIKVTCTADSSTGANVAVDIDGDLEADAGDFITIIDPTSDLQLMAQVVSSTSTTVTLDSLSDVVTSGCLLGEDPVPVGIYSSQAMAFFPTNYAGIDTLPSETNAFYDVRPLGDPFIRPYSYKSSNGYVATPPIDMNASQLNTSTNLLNKRSGKYQLLPMVVQQARTYMPEMHEVRGQLKGVYATGTGGEAVNEDTVTFGGQTYLMFQPNDYGQRTIPFICIGPIS